MYPIRKVRPDEIDNRMCLSVLFSLKRILSMFAVLHKNQTARFLL